MDWINFDEIKPADGQWVLSIDSQGEMETMYYDKNWEHCLCKFGGNLKTFNITHWMPLPEPPKDN
jgi:hypothetical protein